MAGTNDGHRLVATVQLDIAGWHGSKGAPWRGRAARKHRACFKCLADSDTANRNGQDDLHKKTSL